MNDLKASLKALADVTNQHTQAAAALAAAQHQYLEIRAEKFRVTEKSMDQKQLASHVALSGEGMVGRSKAELQRAALWEKTLDIRVQKLKARVSNVGNETDCNEIPDPEAAKKEEIEYSKAATTSRAAYKDAKAAEEQAEEKLHQARESVGTEKVEGQTQALRAQCANAEPCLSL